MQFSSSTHRFSYEMFAGASIESAIINPSRWFISYMYKNSNSTNKELSANVFGEQTTPTNALLVLQSALKMNKQQGFLFYLIKQLSWKFITLNVAIMNMCGTLYSI